MASRRRKLSIAATLAVVGVGGYMLYSAFAVQAHPEKKLAQAPMNTALQVPASLIMALDDSGSMRFQTLFPSRDGGALWGRDSSSQPYSFFYSTGSNAGKLRASDSSRQFVHVPPYPAPRQATPGNDNAAIPPIDAFGFSRSHFYNKAYFDPSVTYRPWRNSDGTFWDDANPKATRVDPNSGSAIVNLTSEVTSNSSSNSNHHAFRIRTGMVLPKGMKYWGSPGCGLNDSNSSSSSPSGWRVLDKDVTASCSANAFIAFFPATFYLPEDEPAPAGFREDRRVLAENACTYGTATGSDRCNMYRYEIRPGNYDSTDAYDAAITNFANWFSYYGARNRSIVAAVTNAMADVNNLRVGYFTINNRNDVTMRDMTAPSDKSDFFDSIYGLSASGSTPNLQAVSHLGEQFRRTGPNAPITLACQKNAGMLFTDGFSNIAGPNVGNVDGGMGDPFSDGHPNTLADIATRYYLDTDNGGLAPLRTGAGFPAGQVPVPAACSTLAEGSIEWKRLDCQANLHMNFYGVTLGSRGIAFDPDVDRDPYAEPFVSWPAYESNERSTIDDIWHATVNTRGDFINAKTPEDITSAIRRVLQSVSSGASPSGAIALTGARIGAGSLTVTPRYEVTSESDGTDWYGDIDALQVSVNPSTREAVLGPAGWSAASRLPAPDVRRIYFGRGGDVLPFSEEALTLNDLCEKPSELYPSMSLCAPASPGGVTYIETMGFGISEAVDYLRGAATHEGVGAGHLRKRAVSKIGDIVNSTPVISAPSDDYGYRSLGAHDGINYGSSYAEYLEAKKTRRYMVYVGANDGMLHAFDGGMDNDGGSIDSNGGRERFAYVPETALGHMGNLLIPNDPTNKSDQKFQHRYYVDGPITVSDAHFGGQEDDWHTVLVGTAGAGGRSVFALDVDDPTGFDGDDRLWEISDLNPDVDEDDRNDIGFVLGKPVIVPVKTRDGDVRWVTIFGNGYHSKNGDAVLFLVDIDDSGAPTIRKIRAVEEAGAGVPSGMNGLGNVVVVDRWGGSNLNTAMRDGFADTVYAADLRGAIWKFDLRDAEPASPTLPLFVTRTITEGGRAFRQPITGGLAASAGAGGGVMLYFGTGSFSFEEDGKDTTQQSLYAINDTERGATTETIGADRLTRYTVGSGATARGLSVDPDSVLLFPQGWHVDLPAGERFVGNPNIASGTVFLPTYVPNATTTGCSAGGSNWLYGLNARTGAPGLSSVYGSPYNLPDPEVETLYGSGTATISLNTGGTAPVKDVGVFALPGLPPLIPEDEDDPPPGATGRNCWMVVTVAGASPMYLPYPCGRQSWRQVQ